MLSQISYILLSLIALFKTYFSWLDKVSQLVYQNFGLIGQIAFFALLLYLVYLIISRIIKSIFQLALRVVFPSLLISGAAAWLLSYNFFQVLPVCLCALILISFVRH